MRTNISAVNDYLECPRKWYWRYVLMRGEERISPALSDGKLWHAVCAGEQELPLDCPDWMERAHEELGRWIEEHPGVKILANELTLESPLDRHFIFGRLDRLVEWNGGLWHWQHKTLAASVPIPVYTRVIARSYHEHAYGHLVKQASRAGTLPDLPYKGTILALARKVTQNPRKGEPKNPFLVEYLALPNSGGILADLVKVMDQMAKYVPLPSSPSSASDSKGMLRIVPTSTVVYPPQNPNACGGPYRNSLCEYIDVCDMRRSIVEMAVINPLEGYGDSSNAA